MKWRQPLYFSLLATGQNNDFLRTIIWNCRCSFYALLTWEFFDKNMTHSLHFSYETNGHFSLAKTLSLESSARRVKKLATGLCFLSPLARSNPRVNFKHVGLQLTSREYIVLCQKSNYSPTSYGSLKHQFSSSCHKGRGNGMLFHTTSGQIRGDEFDRLVVHYRKMWEHLFF